jgi:heme oxygenase (mycobilin-producing)
MSVRLIVDVRVKDGMQEELARAYGELVARAAKEPGLIAHQLCQSLDEPDRWLVVSEWRSVEESTAWDRSEDHGRLLAPMRACFAQAARAAFEVRDEAAGRRTEDGTR